MNIGKVETLVVARAYGFARRTSASAALKPLLRLAPLTLTAGEWTTRLQETLASLRERGVLDAGNTLVDKDELKRRIGSHELGTPKQLAGMVMPALALGVAANDAKTHAWIAKAGWPTAVAAHVLGIEGAASAARLCDALVWRELGLSGNPQQCPKELRAHFLRQRLGTKSGTFESQVRQLACAAASAPRAKVLPEALVRCWLEDRVVGLQSPSLVDEVRGIAREARDGVYGVRKVFISAVWSELHKRAMWSRLTLDEFKTQLVSAHRAGELVLERADLVTLMDPRLVAESETVLDGTRFHFIVRQEMS